MIKTEATQGDEVDDSNYKTAERTINAIRKSLKQWGHYQTDPRHYDKTGMGINLDHRFSSAKLEFSLDSWCGTYGDSSCHTALEVGDAKTFKDAFTRVVSSRLLELLAETADLIERNSDTARQAYIAKLKQEAAELEAIDTERESAIASSGHR